MTGPVRALVAVCLGAGVALGQAPFGLWPLACVALILSFNRAAALTTARAGFWFGAWLGAGYGAVALHWIVEPFLVDAATYGWMAPFGLMAMAAGLGLFWGAGFAFGHWLGRGQWLGLVAGWTAAEALRSFALTGFPWTLVSHIWIGTPAYWTAALVGPVGLTLLTLLAAGALAHLLNRPTPATFGWAVVAVLSVAAPGALMRPELLMPPDTVLRLVQPNAPQHLKWDPEWQETFFERVKGNIDNKSFF